MLGNKRITVIGTGIGPDNIDIMINEIDALKNIDFKTRKIKKQFKKLYIIRMGTSGALRKDIPVDSIVAASHGLGLDGLLNFYEYEKQPYHHKFHSTLKDKLPELLDICIPYIFEGSLKLLDSVGKDYLQGITMTAGGFYGPQGRQLRLNQKIHKIIDKLSDFECLNHNITNFEMETSAIYGLSKLMGHEALSVNAIIANRATMRFSKDPYSFIEKMIVKTLEKIDQLDV
jgi:uridine phosphorylase